MIRKHILLGLICSVLFTMNSQAQLNMNLLGQLDYQALHNSDISDVWGYTDEDGNEYALVGVNNGGVSVVDLSNPANPVEIFFYPGPSSIWRDLKVWQDHAYITTEGGGGLAIIDLSPLPQSTALTAVSWLGDNWQSAHNLWIDEFGKCHIYGANRGNGGVIFLDLTNNPMVPVEIGTFDQWYVHDGMSRGDTLYAAHISDGFFSVVDISDLQNIQVLGTQTTGNNFSHNIWVSDDGDYVFTTDEVSSGYLGSYDISDPTDIKEIDLTLSDPGSGTIPHNTHVIGDFVLTSYYRYGTTVHDISQPHNVIETGFYDTSPQFAGNGFNGSWGAYPYFSSGLGLATDIENGLFVFDIQYVHACWLEGTITDAATTNPIQDVNVDITAISISELSAQNGDYATGYHTAGSYDVTFSKPGYTPQTITGVQLTTNMVTMLDVQLQPLVSFSLNADVIENVSAVGVPNATVSLTSNDFSYTFMSDSNGDVNMNGIFADTYDIAVGAWGWQTICLTGVAINAATAPLSFTLDVGYMDDFAVDLGWTASSMQATAGLWERGVPAGTSIQGTLSNADQDVNGDCFNQAYVTGNAGGSAGLDDVDGGTVTLTSPIMDLSTFISPRINYYRWFFNGGGAGTPNDELRVFLTDGTNTVQVESLDVNSTMSQWVQAPELIVGDHVTINSTVQFIIETEDAPSGHLVEAALDLFEVSEGPLSVSDTELASAVHVYPNPTDEQFSITWGNLSMSNLTVFDAQGRLVLTQAVTGSSFDAEGLDSGCYQIMLESNTGKRIIKPLIVR